jgi:hypothetical protein
MEDHAYWEDKDKLVEGVKSAVKDAIRAARVEGGKVEVVHTVSVRGGGVKRDVKFAGFEEEYDDSEDEDEDVEEEDEIEEDAEEDADEDEDEIEEEEYEGSTEEEDPKQVQSKAVKGKDKGKGVAK